MTNNIQRVTPFIKPISTSGGTLYTFSSAAEDLTFSFNENPQRKFKFSKFALLKIPDISSNSDPKKNYTKLQAIPGAFQSNSDARTTDANFKFAESFQNYCLNLETLILSKESYNQSLSKTVAERVFFKWLKEMGAIRFKANYINNTQKVRYSEESELDGVYEKVVKYIGEIDFVNNYSGQENTYSEVYVHVPTEVGDFPNVYFQTTEDENYYPGMSIARYDDGINNEKVSGRTINDVHPAGMMFDAFYDNDSGLGITASESTKGTVLYKKKSGRSDSENNILTDYDSDSWWWYPTNEKNLYYTEPIEFGNPGNYDLAIANKDSVNIDNTAIKFKRSRLDGIELDFDINDYKTNNNNLTNLIDIARQANSKDFEFNAVLLYYDLYTERTVTPSDKNYSEADFEVNDDGTVTYFTGDSIVQDILATNLYGVLFLDNVENKLSFDGATIPTFKKCRPNNIMNLNGNAYGFKVNLKLDSNPYESGVHVETVISNSNTLSMDLFADALNQMRMAMSSLNKFTYDNLNNDQRLRQLEELHLLNKDYSNVDLVNRIKVLESVLLNETTLNYTKDRGELISLINQNYQMLQDVISGKINSKLVVDMDMFKSGTGMNIIKKSDSQIEFSVISQEYNIGETSTTSVFDNWIVAEKSYSYECPLREMKNYLRLEESRSFTPNKDLKLYINDRTTKWTTGQVFRLYLAQEYQVINENGNFDMYIYTGDGTNQSIDSSATNISSSNISSRNWKAIAKITAWDFQKRNFRPVIEIICVNDKTLEFKIDYLN